MWHFDWHEPQALDGNIKAVGSVRNIFEKRAVPLCFTQPYYSPGIWGKNRVVNVPVRLTETLREDRGDEALQHGSRLFRKVRSLEYENPDLIAAANKKEDEEFAERIRRSGGEKVRWWHTRHVHTTDSLKTLKLCNFTFSPDKLVSAKEIVILNLTGCKLGDQSMNWVATAMQQNMTLRRLILQGNHLSGKGVEQLVPGIKDARALIEIDLSFNPIGDDGVNHLLQGMSHNIRKCILSKICLGACALSPNASYHLLRMMRDFSNMQCLLLWRNNLGLPPEDGMDKEMSGIGLILEELRVNRKMRLLDLSATNLSESDLGKFATDLERAAREKRIADVQHKSRAQRIADMSDEIDRRRRDAVWEDEKYAVRALERELAAERLKFREQVERDAKEKQAKTANDKWKDRVHELTGKELIENKIKIRLILKANPSVTPSTIKRLGAFFDVRDCADFDEFINRPRVFDNILVPRRKVGDFCSEGLGADKEDEQEEYFKKQNQQNQKSEGTVAVSIIGQDSSSSNNNNKFKNEQNGSVVDIKFRAVPSEFEDAKKAVEDWYDPFRSENEYERQERLEKAKRRKKLEELRTRSFEEEEREKREREAEVDKYFEDPVAKLKAREKEDEYDKLSSPTQSKELLKKIDQADALLDDDLSDIKSYSEAQKGAGEHAKRGRHLGVAVGIEEHHQHRGGGATAAAAAAATSAATAAAGGGGGGDMIEGEQHSSSASPSREKHRINQMITSLEMNADIESSNSRSRAARQFDDSFNKVRDQQDANGSSAPISLESISSVDILEGLNKEGEGEQQEYAFFSQLYNLVSSWKQLDQLISSGAKTSNIEQARSFIASEKTNVVQLLSSRTQQQQQQQQEQEQEGEGEGQQQAMSPLQVTNDARFNLILLVLEEIILRQPQDTPINFDLVQLILQTVDLDWPKILSVRVLVPLAAAAGAFSYFDLLLCFVSSPDAAGGLGVDMFTLLQLVTSHPAQRIALTTVLLQRAGAQVLGDGSDDSSLVVMQRFVRDICSLRQDQQQESLPYDLLATLLAAPEFAFLTFTKVATGSDNQGLAESIFTRACYEGNLQLLELLVQYNKIADFNVVPSASSTPEEQYHIFTPLMLAVVSDVVDVVKFLTNLASQKIGNLSLDYKTPKENLNALDIASIVGKNENILLTLRSAGLKSRAEAQAAKEKAAAAAAAAAGDSSSGDGPKAKGSRAAMARALAANRMSRAK